MMIAIDTAGSISGIVENARTETDVNILGEMKQEVITMQRAVN